MTIEELRDRKLIVWECISGSKAYGLDTPESDTDIKGVFILPKEELFGLSYTAQVSDEKNDTVFYELGRFFELLAKNNPNIIELLGTSADSTLYKHSFLDAINNDLFISKLCRDSFGSYALSQIRKAKGLNKKILNPIDKKRKTIFEFCYVLQNDRSIPLQTFLDQKNLKQENCGLAKVSNMKGVYTLYHSPEDNFRGIAKSDLSNDIALSSIPKGLSKIAILYFNIDRYSAYCKEYHAYWEWVKKRNEARYENTLMHGKSYDSKNMMHTFRLLEMAIEIAKTGAINIKRSNREELLKIKSGLYDYEELVNRANQLQLDLENAFEQSTLPDRPDLLAIENLLIELRIKFYSETK